MEVSFMSNAKQIDQLLEGFLKRGLPGCGLKVVQYGNTLPSGIYVQNSALHSYDDAL